MSALEITRRPASDSDFEFLRALHRSAMKEYVEATWGWVDEVQEKLFREAFVPSRVEILQVGGEDIGVLSLERRLNELFLANIAIVPKWQKRGVGTFVIESLFDTCPLTLRVLKVNPARALYERLGFVLIGETATHYEMRRNPD